MNYYFSKAKALLLVIFLLACFFVYFGTLFINDLRTGVAISWLGIQAFILFGFIALKFMYLNLYLIETKKD